MSTRYYNKDLFKKPGTLFRIKYPFGLPRADRIDRFEENVVLYENDIIFLLKKERLSNKDIKLIFLFKDKILLNVVTPPTLLNEWKNIEELYSKYIEKLT